MHTLTANRDATMSVVVPEPDFAVQLREELEAPDVRHVLSLFANDVQQLMVLIADAARKGECQAMRRQVHALAGAAGAVGASVLEKTCRTAMAELRTDTARLPALLTALEIAAHDADLALQRVLAELPHPTIGRA